MSAIYSTTVTRDIIDKLFDINYTMIINFVKLAYIVSTTMNTTCNVNYGNSDVRNVVKRKLYGFFSMS